MQARRGVKRGVTALYTANWPADDADNGISQQQAFCISWDPSADDPAQKRRRLDARRPQRAGPAGAYAVMDHDCPQSNLRLVRRWVDRVRARLEAERADGGAWWDAAARALWPPPDRAGALLIVSSILCGHPFSASYETLVADVPERVLDSIAWHGPRVVLGLCIHPSGCGAVASRPHGSPAHPHSDRVMRVAIRISPDDAPGDANDSAFTIGQLVATIADVCAGRLVGKRLQAVLCKMRRWYTARSRWRCAATGSDDADESIDAFVERRVLLRQRTGCTTAALISGRLSPCDWLAGAHGPVLSPPLVPMPIPRKGKETVWDEDGDGGPYLDLPTTDNLNEGQRRADDDGTASTTDDDIHVEGDGQIMTPDDDHDDNNGSDDDSSIRRRRLGQGCDAVARSDNRKRRRVQEMPSLRCVYDRIVCRRAPGQGGDGVSCIYIQSRLCAAEDGSNV